MLIMETVSQIKMSFHIKMELFKMIPWYLIRSRYCLSFVRTCIHPRFLCGSVLLIVLDFLCCPVVCLCVLGSCCDFRMEAMFGSSLNPVVCKRHVVFAWFFFVLCTNCVANFSGLFF